MESKATKDWRFWVFLVLSIIWSIRVFWLLIEDQYLSDFSGSMPLNEVGDFLAGSFSPLAFAWLAYGYWMQNKELNNAVQQSKESQKLLESQFEFQKKTKNLELLKEHNSSQPIFSITALSIPLEKLNREKKIQVSVKNIGHSIKHLNIIKVSYLSKKKESLIYKEYLLEMEEAQFKLEVDTDCVYEDDLYEKSDRFQYIADVRISFYDATHTLQIVDVGLYVYFEKSNNSLYEIVYFDSTKVIGDFE